MLVVQRIETLWTKESRGMPNAAKRNAVPRTLPLPRNDTNQGLYLHEVKASERDNFKLHQSTELWTDISKYWSLEFLQQDTVIEVLFTYNYYRHGKPSRGAYRRPLFTLVDGQVGVLHINGRFAFYSGQYYVQNFVNVANVCAVESGIFINGVPDFFVDETRNLF